MIKAMVSTDSLYWTPNNHLFPVKIPYVLKLQIINFEFKQCPWQYDNVCMEIYKQQPVQYIMYNGNVGGTLQKM